MSKENSVEAEIERRVADAEALGWAKSRAWHHYGIAWGHLERISQEELLVEARAELLATPAIRALALQPREGEE